MLGARMLSQWTGAARIRTFSTSWPGSGSTFSMLSAQGPILAAIVLLLARLVIVALLPR